ncbi:hypothetical protein IC582_021898 [Cucumis melo]
MNSIISPSPFLSHFNESHSIVNETEASSKSSQLLSSNSINCGFTPFSNFSHSLLTTTAFLPPAGDFDSPELLDEDDDSVTSHILLTVASMP